MAQKEAALRKRQQIAQSSRTMFIWVAIASAVIGFALVVSWFLVQQITFRQKVVSKKMDTAAKLSKNNATISDLQNNIRKVEATSDALKAAKANDAELPLQVVLDALPATNNPLALGSSLQEKLVGGQSGVTLEALNTVGVTTSTVAKTVGGTQSMPFTMTVTSGSPDALQELLKRLERSVRTIDIDNLRIEQSASKTSLTVTAHAFYLPEKTIELQKTTVKPDGAK